MLGGAAVEAPSAQRPLVVVTGSSGLLGSRICRELLSNHRVVGLDRAPPREGAGEAWIECDLTEDESVARALVRLREEHGRAIASVLHLAAYYDFSGEPSPLYRSLTVEGTRRLLRGLRALEVEQLVFSSSTLAMAPVEPGERLDERSPTAADWDYPRSKLEAERVLREERGSLPVVVLRIAGVYDLRCHSIPLAQQIKRIFERDLESHFFPGDAERGQAYVHLDDLVRCFRAVVEQRASLGPEELFVIGEPDVVSYREAQDILGLALHGEEWTTLRIPAPLAKAGAWVRGKLGGSEFIQPWMIDLADAHRPLDVSRAERVLGWRPRARLRAELERMAQVLLADPAAWYAENGLEPPAPRKLAELRREAR